MKYKVTLVLVFSCIVLFAAEQKVKGLSFTFYCLPVILMPPYAYSNKSNINKSLAENKENWKKQISYQIFFEDGTVEKKEIPGKEVKELIEKKEDIEETLRHVLEIFNKGQGMDEVNEQVLKEINASEEKIKNNYIKKNKEHWKQEYTEQHAEAWKNEYETQLKNQKKNEKKSLIERLKDPGLVLLGAGLGFGFDRYMLKK